MKQNRINSPRASRIRRLLPRIAIALVLISLVSIVTPGKTGAPGKTSKPRRAQVIATTICITDSRTGDNIQFTNPGGAYTFTQCSTGFTLSGTGTVSSKSGVITLTDRKPDRSVNAGLNPNTKTGSAAIYFTPVPGGGTRVFRINQTNPNQTCGCVVSCAF